MSHTTSPRLSPIEVWTSFSSYQHDCATPGCCVRRDTPNRTPSPSLPTPSDRTPSPYLPDTPSTYWQRPASLAEGLAADVGGHDTARVLDGVARRLERVVADKGLFEGRMRGNVYHGVDAADRQIFEELMGRQDRQDTEQSTNKANRQFFKSLLIQHDQQAALTTINATNTQFFKSLLQQADQQTIEPYPNAFDWQFAEADRHAQAFLSPHQRHMLAQLQSPPPSLPPLPETINSSQTAHDIFEDAPVGSSVVIALPAPQRQPVRSIYDSVPLPGPRRRPMKVGPRLEGDAVVVLPAFQRTVFRFNDLSKDVWTALFPESLPGPPAEVSSASAVKRHDSFIASSSTSLRR